jgi:NAD(P) transhydrogenase subunit beta
MLSEGLVTVAYIGSTILFILALGGLSNQETARRGNTYGMIGMALAVIATIFGVKVFGDKDFNATIAIVLIAAVLIGSAMGLLLAKKVAMTQMPELVAVLHSLVGLAAVLVGYVNFMGSMGDESILSQFVAAVKHSGTEATIHNIETYIGVLIGAMTFSGSIVAFLKLSGRVGGKPLLIPARHYFNLALLLAAVWFGVQFVQQAAEGAGLLPLMIMTLIALVFGIHMVMAIGGADMPVVVSMLNSYSGWAAAATGFMLSNDLLIVTGALVGSSGAILSYIMCRAMNRNFISVIAGGFGAVKATGESAEIEGEVVAIQADEVAEMLLMAKEVMIIPGYGMAVAQAQHVVHEISDTLRKKGVNVRFGIHPVAGRMPGHMNVLLAEARVPYDIVFEMEEVNEDFPEVDVSIVIGANDIVNPSALDDPNSPIAGMPVLECWKGKNTIVLKRGMATGYAGVENPLFYKENTRMLFGDAKASMDAVFKAL